MFKWWKSRRELKEQLEFVEADRKWARNRMQMYHRRLCDERSAHGLTTQKLKELQEEKGQVIDTHA